MKILKNQQGIAIFMVLAAVAIAAPVVYKFTEESLVNRFRGFNIESRAKSRLVAESALKFAMARLRLYQEAYNFIQSKGEAASKVVSQENLDMIWNFPFVYPIPETAEMNAIQKDALRKFAEQSFLEGSFQVTINNMSNKINLNMLRISLLNEARKKANIPEGQEPPAPTEEELKFTPEAQLFNALSQSIELKAADDEIFDSKFYGIDLNPLIEELKFYISDPNALESVGGADRAFDERGISPKRAPMTSYSEMYSLPSWPDEIVRLIENEFTPHGSIMIDLNQINDTLLRLLIPDILPEDIQEFFNWKNLPEDPKYFNSLDDFKNYIVTIGNIMTASEFDERFDNFKKQGLKFGVTPSLFKISINAQVEESSYKLTAYVTIPAKPEPRPLTQNPPGTPPGTPPQNPPETNPQNPGSQPNGQNPGGNNLQKQKSQLLMPRILEIIVG